MRKLMILVFAAAVLVAFTTPAFAQSQWSFYGSARMWTAWANTSQEASGTSLIGASATAWDEDAGLVWNMQDNSRIGAKVAAGNIGGTFEYGNNPGVYSPGASSASTPTVFEATRVRLLFGTWNFGAGTLLVGQDYTPLFFPISDQCGLIGGDCGMIFWGTLYTGRVPQLKLIMGGFQVALLNQNAPASKVAAVAGSTAYDQDYTTPELEASYTFNLGPVALMLGGFYKTYDDIAWGATIGEKSYSIDSWGGTVAMKSAFGPFYVNAQVNYGKNIGDFGMTADLLYKTGRYVAATDSIEDATYFGGALILGFKLTDAWKFEGGIGYMKGDTDTGINSDAEQDTTFYYLQAMWSPAKNVFIVPEFGWVDYGKNDVTTAGVTTSTDLGSGWYLGIKWQINF
jgi:hypothetical protein